MVKKPKENKKAKETKMLEDYKNSLFNDEILQKSYLRFKSDYHNVYTEIINKIALSNNDDKRIQTFDKITTYPYRASDFKVCESEMMTVKDYFVKNYTDCPFYCKSISIRNKLIQSIQERDVK